MAEVTRLFFPSVATYAPPRLRLGLSIAHTRSHEWRDQTLRLLNPPVWKDWTGEHIDMPGFMPSVFTMTRVAYSAKARQDAAAYPAVMWELGNEPELPISPVAPAIAAEMCGEWCTATGSNFAAPGIIIHPPGLDWLEQYLAAGGPVGNFWNIHIYHVTDAGGWADKWQTWCDWMQAHDLVRPTIISETCGEHSPVTAQMGIMTHIAGLLRTDARLHTVLWYSDCDWWESWPNSNLRTVAGELTELGEYYLALTK